jgi:hypothetical protein
LIEFAFYFFFNIWGIWISCSQIVNAGWSQPSDLFYIFLFIFWVINCYRPISIKRTIFDWLQCSHLSPTALNPYPYLRLEGVQKVNISYDIQKAIPESRSSVISRKFANFPTFRYLTNYHCEISICFQSPIQSLNISTSHKIINHMSPYDGVVIGKLKLKGKPLNVKDGGIKKKNKQHNKSYNYFSEFNSGEYYAVCIFLFLMHLTDSNSFL